MTENSRTKALVKNTSWAYLGKMVVSLLQVIVTILVIKKLNVDLYGTYNFLVGSFIIFQFFATSQIGVVFNRYIPELIINKDYLKVKKIINYGFIFLVISFSFLLTSIYFLRKPYGDFFNIPNFESYLLPFSYYVAAFCLRWVMMAIINSLLLHKPASLISIITNAVKAISYIVVLPSLTISTMLYIEGTVALLYSLLISVPAIKFVKKLDFDQSKVSGQNVSKKRVVRFGLFSVFNELGAQVVGTSSDLFIISAMSNPFAVGLYAFANKIYQTIFNFLPLSEFRQILSTVFFQKFTTEYDKTEFVTVFNFIIKVMLPIFIFPTLYFLLFGKAVISYVFDPKYLEAYWVTNVVLANGIFVAWFYPVGITVSLKERMDISFYSKSVVIFSILAGVFGMKYFGIVGVAFATILGNILKYLMMLYLMRDKADMVFKFKEYKKYFFVVVTVAIPFVFTNHLIVNVWLLVLFSVVFLAVYAVLMILYHPFTREDLVLVERISDSSPIIQRIKPYVVKLYSFKPVFGGPQPHG